MAIDPDLNRRGRLVRSLGALREMLPGSFVERVHKCGRSNCRCADGKQLHTSFQLSVLIQGKPKTFHVPVALVQEVRAQVELRKRFDEAAAQIASLNLRRFLRRKEK